MVLLDSYDWENLLNEASKIDDRLNDNWMELVADEEYLTLIEFFDKDNYSRYNEDFEEYIEVNTKKRLQEILRGKDRIELIRYAFVVGQLVGQAAQIVMHKDD